MLLATEDPLAVEATAAIQGGDLVVLARLLAENPGLAGARLGDDVEGRCGAGRSRSLLHVAADWPGNFPNGAATVGLLIAAGADVGARFAGPHVETPLHWAASCDDVAVLDALLDAGADIEAEGAVIGGGTPLADACAFGQWDAARRLVERGARATLWQAASLGLMDRVEAAFAGGPPAGRDVTNAFWCACHGGQREAAEYLLDRGADRDWIGHDDLTPLDAAARSGAGELVEWLRSRGARSAAEAGGPDPAPPPADLELFVTEWLGALGRGDLDRAAACLDPEVVWQGVREDFVCRGRAQVVEMLRAMLLRRPRSEAIEVVAGEDAIVLGLSSPDLREIGGVALAGRLFSVYRLRGRRIAAVEDHLSREAALRAAGAVAPDWDAPEGPPQT